MESKQASVRDGARRRIQRAWEAQSLTMGEAADLFGLLRSDEGTERAEYLLTVLEREGESEFRASLLTVLPSTDGGAS